MSDHASTRVGIGSRVMFDGEIHTITEWLPTAYGTDVVLTSGTSIVRVSLVTLLDGTRARLLPTNDAADPSDDVDPAALTLAALTKAQAGEIRRRADHMREMLTGYRAGSPELALPDEPRPQYAVSQSLLSRYAAKADELNISVRQVRRLARDYQRHGEAGLASARWQGLGRTDPRWLQTALQIMVEHTNESKPSRKAVILQTKKRLELWFGPGAVELPSRATAYRNLEWLEKQHRLFGGTTNRNRDIAERPKRAYGKLRPTRPGEFLLLDTTRLDVFALDPKTLKWVRVELTVAMDWYTRCVVAARMTPVSTKGVDAAAVMYHTLRPKPAGEHWPSYAVWPEHGLPREVLIDPDQWDRTGTAASGPALNPETIITDHGKIYVSPHLTSVCQRFGFSMQPARVKVGRDKGPLERFFGTVRECLLQYLPGYKGSDVNSRGLDVEGHACLYIDQLEEIFLEWVATVYHHKPHDGLIVPGLRTARGGETMVRKPMTPAQMFSQGIARAGYIEAPRDPQLAYEFLQVEPHVIQHNGIKRGTLIYGDQDGILTRLAATPSPYRGKFAGKWPIHVDPDDVSRVYIKDPDDRTWHTLVWEHHTRYPMPFSDEALRYTRTAVRRRDGAVDEQVALDELLTRHNIRLGDSPANRRIALRMARHDADLSRQAADDPTDDAEVVAGLTSLRHLNEQAGDDGPAQYGPEPSDDDDDDEVEDDFLDDDLEWA
jgi:transposase InsO family protein